VGRGGALSRAAARGPSPRPGGRARNPDLIVEPAERPSPRAAWDAFARRCPGTASVDLILPDLAGIARGKRLTAAAFESTIEAGLTFASSVYGIDGTGENVAASGLIWEEGDADRPCLVDWTTLAPVPWREGGAQALAGLAEHDGRPFFADPRALLRRVAGRFAALGLRPVCALELEFYLLKDPGAPGQAHPAPGQVYGLEPLDEREAFLSRLAGYCAAQGLPAKSAVSEYSPGQLEVNLGHVEAPLSAADHGFLLKRAIKAAARAEGLVATFMAKPLAGQSPSGLHVHVSLVDQGGGNRFAQDERALGHAIAGLQATMAEGMLLFAPNANSYRRLRPLSYAPTAPTWGHNNRTVALRVPTGAAAARRIEHRVAGADANPYLVLAAVLAGIHHGLAQELEPSAPIAGNAYDQVAPSLPLSWERAIAALAGARVLNDYLGEAFCRLYRVCRAAERDRFADVITPTEYAWYLNTV
jgi:glutamine synthetase